MTTIRMERLAKSYGDQPVLHELSLEVRAGELLTLLGASGSGKTTLLRILAGLERADTGRVVFGDTVVQDGAACLAPQKRGLGMVFQNYALWPHLDVLGNLALALREQGLPRADIAQRVDEALQTVGLAGLQRRAIHQLSGGQQQRVALARALVARPKVLLMDEPLSNLDAGLREQLRDEIRALQQRLGITTVFVTHDQTEALAMSDRIALLHQGRLVELGSPEQVYTRPQSPYAAHFLGKANVLDGHAEAEGWARVGQMRLRLAAPSGSGAVQILIRPEALSWAQGQVDNVVDCSIAQVHMLGPLREYTVQADSLGCSMVLLEPSSLPPHNGSARVHLPPQALRAWSDGDAAQPPSYNTARAAS